jgi:hypothetical protein
LALLRGTLTKVYFVIQIQRLIETNSSKQFARN